MPKMIFRFLLKKSISSYEGKQVDSCPSYNMSLIISAKLLIKPYPCFGIYRSDILFDPVNSYMFYYL